MQYAYKDVRIYNSYIYCKMQSKYTNQIWKNNKIITNYLLL